MRREQGHEGLLKWMREGQSFDRLAATVMVMLAQID